MTAQNGPIGVFDSGLGGLTVVREILNHLPNEQILYVGDTAHVPYGGRSRDEIRGFSLRIGGWLAGAGCRAIVVACNTATAAGVDALRSSLPIPIVGMEPGVKPAAAITRSRRVAVLATVSTLSADRFNALCEQYAGGIEVITQPCPGLVECVERGDLKGPETRALVEQYVKPLIARGVDTIVLGCTHYPLLRPLIAEIAGPGVTIIDTGDAVARQVVRVIGASAKIKSRGNTKTTPEFSCVEVYATGRDAADFAGMAQHFLRGVAIVRPGRLVWFEGELQNASTAN